MRKNANKTKERKEWESYSFHLKQKIDQRKHRKKNPKFFKLNMKKIKKKIKKKYLLKQ